MRISMIQLLMGRDINTFSKGYDMVEVLKTIEAPVIVALLIVIILQFKIISRFMDITDKNGKAIQELTTWIKTRFSVKDNG